MMSSAPEEYYNKSLMELLWQDGPVPVPLQPDRPPACLMEMVRLLTQYQIWGNGSGGSGGGGGGGGGNMICSELPDPSATRRSPAEESNVTSAGKKGEGEPINSRKRIARDDDNSVAHAMDVETGNGKKRKEIGQRATRTTRAAEIHTLSERRRRNRINEKMKVLQELVPRCNKSDKASMLDDAIEYVKTLQSQVLGNIHHPPNLGYNLGYLHDDVLNARRVHEAGNNFSGLILGHGNGQYPWRCGTPGPVLPYAPVNVGHAPALIPSTFPWTNNNIANYANNNQLVVANQQDPTFMRGPNMLQIIPNPHHHLRYVGLQYPQSQIVALNQEGVSKERRDNINQEIPNG